MADDAAGVETDTRHNAPAQLSESPEDSAGTDPGPAEDNARDAASASGIRTVLIAVVAILAALAGLVGWLGFRANQSHRDEYQRALFLQVGRQAALNLTTINHDHVEADVQRILDSSTGAFHDDFNNRAQPFIEVVKQAKSTTVGSITAAGLESVQGDGAQVLIAVSVRTSNAGAPEQEPRAWRMRIAVQKLPEGTKVSNVQFVP